MLNSFPGINPKLDDNKDEDEEQDADDNTDVCEVTSVLVRDFEEPKAWAVLDVDNNLLILNGSLTICVELAAASG